MDEIIIKKSDKCRDKFNIQTKSNDGGRANYSNQDRFGVIRLLVELLDKI